MDRLKALPGEIPSFEESWEKYLWPYDTFFENWQKFFKKDQIHIVNGDVFTKTQSQSLIKLKVSLMSVTFSVIRT